MARTADPTDIPRRLTAAGYALFTQAGYNATGIAQITEQAGVPKGSFYNHFDSKEAFAASILRHYADLVSVAWQDARRTAPASPLGSIDHIFSAFIAHHGRNQCQGCLVGNFAGEMVRASPMCRQVLDDILLAWRQQLATLIAQAQVAGQVRTDLDSLTLSSFFWDAWEGALLRAKVANSTAPLQDTLRLMLDKIFAPTGSARLA